MWRDNEICGAQVNLKRRALHFQALGRQRLSASQPPKPLFPNAINS
jgi:hypothetical protein